MMPVEASAGHEARETDHPRTSPHTQQEADSCLPHLCSPSFCSLGRSTEFTSVLLKICAEFLQQLPQHRRGLIFTLNEKNGGFDHPIGCISPFHP